MSRSAVCGRVSWEAPGSACWRHQVGTATLTEGERAPGQYRRRSPNRSRPRLVPPERSEPIWARLLCAIERRRTAAVGLNPWHDEDQVGCRGLRPRPRRAGTT